MINKSLRYVFVDILVLMSLYACGTAEPDIKEPEKNEEKKTCVTSGYSDLTEISVKLFGYANLTSDMTGTIDLGFVYSTEKTPSLDNGIKITTKEINSENQFSITVKNLLSNTTYYYCAFVRRNGIFIYGDVKSFTTKEIKPIVEPDSITIDPSVMAFDGKAGTGRVTVTANTSWSTSGAPAWVTVTPASGSKGTTTVTLSVQLGVEKARSAVIVFTAGKASKTVTVSQSGNG